MSFQFTRYGLLGSAGVWQRALEILPGALSWSVLLGMTGLSFGNPLVAAVLIIAFDLYWLFRLAYMTVFLVLSYAQLSVEQATDWMQRIQELEGTAADPSPGPRCSAVPGWKGRLSRWRHARELDALRRSGTRPPPLEAIHHVVIFPVANELRGVYEPGVQSLLRQQFPARRILVVLAVEGRAHPQILGEAQAVQQQYREHLLDLLVIVHPDGQPGEARVKGANATHAAKAVAASLRERGIPFAHVLVSCFDADTVVDPTYFACLTYHFMACPHRTRASFQPIPVYHNNVWEVPGFARVLDVGASFFQLVEATNPETLVTFSSHSMSFQALVEVGFWPVDMISDDSAIFWKALIHYDGDYHVVPMYVTISMDVAASDSWRRTAVNVYKQKRRWAWGVENLPIVFRGFWPATRFPLRKKLSHMGKLLEGHLSWATWPFLLGIIGWLPALFAGQQFSSSVLYYTAPRITGTIFGLASLGLLTTIVLSQSLLPNPPARHPFVRRLAHMIEWCLVPLIAIAFSAVPALEAQTRLMLGRRLEFWVTEKPRPFNSRHGLWPWARSGFRPTGGRTGATGYARGASPRVSSA